MPNKLNWNELNVFLAIAREKSLTGAALQLGVTHSTVFRKINALESQINVKLFSRNSGAYKLTDIGREVLSHVENVASHIDGLNQLLDNRNNKTQGKIHITAPHNLAYKFFPRYFQEFTNEYPEITINLMASNKEYDLSQLEADMAIRATHKPPEELIGRKLLSLRWAAYASEQYIEKRGRPESLNDLKQHLIVSSDQTLLELPAFQWIEENISSDAIIVRCNDLMSMSAFAESGVAIAFLPDDQAKPTLHRLFELPSDIFSDIWILIHPNMRQCKRLIVLRDFLINKFRSDPFFQI